MTQRNLCTLTGAIGNVTRNVVDEKMVVRASLATHFIYKNSNAETVIETSWHEIRLWEGKNISREKLEVLQKGSKVTITGRMINEKYTDKNGNDVYNNVVICYSLSLENKDSKKNENKIEIVGRVGHVQKNTMGGTKAVRMSVGTNYVYRNKAGNPVIESTWHSVNVFTGNKFPEEEIDKIETGTPVSITGRLSYQTYTTKEGETRKSLTIIPTAVEILELSEEKENNKE